MAWAVGLTDYSKFIAFLVVGVARAAVYCAPCALCVARSFMLIMLTVCEWRAEVTVGHWVVENKLR